jgi:hypothetical protein
MKLKYSCETLYCNRKDVGKVIKAELAYTTCPVMVNFFRNEFDASNIDGPFIIVGVVRYGLKQEVKLVFNYCTKID